jgi:hypothetical protein
LPFGGAASGDGLEQWFGVRDPLEQVLPLDQSLHPQAIEGV